MPRLLRIADAVDYTGLSERHLRRLIAAGRIGAIRPAGIRVVLVPEEELSRLIGFAHAVGVDGKASLPVEEAQR